MAPGQQKKRRAGGAGHRKKPRWADYKIHLASDERGRIRTLVFTAGQTADVSQALNLVSIHRPQRLVADRAYDADYVLHFLDSEGCQAIIPPKRSRKEQRPYDRSAYRSRNIIERTIRRLKECKKVATRYEKTTPSFAALCYLAATFINLRLDVNTP